MPQAADPRETLPTADFICSPPLAFEVSFIHRMATEITLINDTSKMD